MASKDERYVDTSALVAFFDIMTNSTSRHSAMPR